MSVLYCTSFKYSDGELRKNHELMDFNPHNYYDQQQQQQQQEAEQQQNQHNSGLLRYRSAPSSFFDSLVTGTNGGGIGSDEYRFSASSSPEMDTMLERFVSQGNGSGDHSNSHDLQEFESGERPATTIKQEVTGLDMVFQQSFRGQNLGHHNSVSGGNSLDRAFGFDGLDNSKMGSGNGSNLVRQNSSPAGLFSNLGVDNGFSLTGDAGNSKVQNGTNGEARSSRSRLSNHVSFSPSEQRFLPQIAELGDESIRSTTPVGDNRKRHYLPSFQNESWDDTSLRGLKRVRDNDGNTFSAFNTLDNQHGSSGNCVTGLTHHLSLPKTAAEMATIEKYLQFQGSVPCKIRAKRGCATHPRSIAERVRRTRISERMRKLQDLFPNMDKQTNTADMLELAVEYIKDLQIQVKTLTDYKARCTCTSTRKPYSSASA